MKEELIEALKRLGMGRLDAAQTVADLLIPDQLTFGDLEEIKDNCTAAAEDLKAETVEIEYAELSKSTNPGTIKALADTVEEAKKLFGVPPEPAKPKRKKA